MLGWFAKSFRTSFYERGIQALDLGAHGSGLGLRSCAKGLGLDTGSTKIVQGFLGCIKDELQRFQGLYSCRKLETIIRNPKKVK